MLSAVGRQTTMAVVPLVGQVRGMATLKEIRNRLKSVKSIQKITKSMKMVSAAKYARAERELKGARPYGVGSQSFYKEAEVIVPPKEGEKKVLPSDEFHSDSKRLIVAITSDRGLCGAIHSGIGKYVKSILGKGGNPDTLKVVCVGDKSRSLLHRGFGKHILMVFNEIGKKSANFLEASKIAQQIMDSEYNFDEGIIIYNYFKTVVSYQATEIPVVSLDTIMKAPKIGIYDSLDADVLLSYREYSLASLIYYALKENATSEQAARMTAMDGASKNAGEMIDKLTLTFNRTRQAVITRELIEIISGAAAL